MHTLVVVLLVTLFILVLGINPWIQRGGLVHWQRNRHKDRQP